MEDLWLFKFTLEDDKGNKLNRKKAEELMDVIINWAENNYCQVGGGYRAPKKDEFDNETLFDNN